jgi:hypothetical protein
VDVGRLCISTRDVERLAIQKACQRTAHCRPEVIQLQGIEGVFIQYSCRVVTFELNKFLCLQIHIRIEHTMGLLKGRFQTLKEIRIQLVNTRRHMIIIMWACICIVLHNLIIRIEGDNFDEEWRDGLVQTGLDLKHGADTDEKDEPDDELGRARQ